MARTHDHIGQETLERMKVVDRYNDWIIERLSPWIGNAVLEVGSGIGNFSHYFLDKNKLVLTDVRDDYITGLKERYGGHSNVDYELYDLEGPGDHLSGRGIDTVVALNVLEHIENDRRALKELNKIIVPGGRVILQLPAHRLLYGSLDINLDHFRRYTVSDIKGKFRESGFLPEHFFRMNMPGALGWFVYSRILKHEILPKGSLGLFNKLTPLFMAAERIISPPIGLSIIAIGRKASDN